MKRLLLISWIFLLSISFGLTKAKADVRMPLIFGDHMVLQQDTKIAIWGWADAGENIEVAFAGQKVRTTAHSDGTWKVNLKPIKTKKDGQTLTITGKNKLAYSDVLVGDVWVASGQSNMEWGIKVRKEYADDIAGSEDPLLRLFFVPKNTALQPLTDIEVPQGTASPERAARWVLCTPEMLAKINGQGFSATAYYFARDMRAANGRPLGVIQSAWGGTRAEAWTSLSGLKQEPALAHYVTAYEKNVKDNPEILATYPRKQKEFDEAVREWDKTVGKEWNQAQKEWAIAVKAAQADGKPAPPKPQPRVPRPPNPRKPHGGNNGPSNLFNAMISPLIPLSIKGVIWYQGEFNSGGSAKEYATLFSRMIMDWREKWGIGDFPFVYVQLPNFEPVDQQPSVEGNGWRWVREGQLKALNLPNTAMAVPRPPNPRKPHGGNNGPSNLFNAMISPLIPLSIKGVIWYQGEFNSGGSAKEYATLFSRMIMDWREKWGIGDFPFVYVQLPNFEPVDQQPSVEGNGWRWVREGQLKALNLPNTAMAVTIDVGDPFDLHPVDKYDVGHRLALAARRLAYGEKVVGMGPLYKKMSVKGNKIILEFTNQGKKLMMGTSPYIPAGEPPHPKPTKLTGFGIAGADRKFVWADAVIEGNKVIVSSSEVAVPVAVRYGFSNSPRCNLYNEKGLPASPFRTDNWDK